MMRASLLSRSVINTRSVAVSASVALAVAGLAVVAAPAAHADGYTGVTSCDETSCTTTFRFTGYAEDFVVPAGVTSVTSTVSGAPGGTNAVTSDLPGGQGGISSGTIAVSPGDGLTVSVGQSGSTGGTERAYGGGGAVPPGSRSGSGGGRSSLSGSGGVLLIAGGGGGGGYAAAGGAGGGAVGDNGGQYDGAISHPSAAGGGSQSAGGTAGRATCCGFTDGYPPGGAGDQPAAGDGGDGNHFRDGISDGGAGGGGYHGGGGGSVFQGGGGGSGYLAPSVTDAATQTGGSNAGSVAITWQKLASTTTLTAAPDTNLVSTDSVTLTATVAADSETPTGTVTFTDGGATLDGCATRPLALDLTATCETTLAAGSRTVAARYNGSTTHKSSTSAVDALSVAAPPAITTDSLAGAIYGEAYSQTLTATGGYPDYTFTLDSGTLPEWLSLDSDGTLAGTPTAATADNSPITFTVKLTDDAGHSTTKDYTLAVAKRAQEVSFEFDPATPTVGSSYDITTSTKGAGSNDLVFTGNHACTVAGTTVSFVHVGTCTVTATQDADDNHAAAQSVSHDAEVTQAEQTLTVTSDPPPSKQVGGSHALTVSGGSSSEPVVVTVDPDTQNDACTLGPVTNSVVDGDQRAATTISLDKVGTCVVRLAQAGDDDHADAADGFVTIEVTGKPTSTTVSVTPTTVVHGQLVRATATVAGNSDGAVYFYVDERLWDVQDLDANTSGDGGTATSRNLAEAFRPTLRKAVTPQGRPTPRSLDVGAHDVTAVFRPDDTDTYAQSGPLTAAALTVTPAKSTTVITVTRSSVTATVTVSKPSADLPSGKVFFAVAGKGAGLVDLVDGVATLGRTLPAGAEGKIAAVYFGRKDDNGGNEITGSSASTARKNPSVTTTVTSSKARNRAGWYTRPVTVRFACKAGSGAITSCPKPVTVSRDGVTTVSRTVQATDGGAKTVNVTVKLDRTRPTVKVGGVKAGAVYAGVLPKATCNASDATSGIASCTITKTAHGTTVTYRAKAVDRAGHVSRASVSVQRTPIVVSGADYSGATPTVHRERSYTIVYTGKGTPHYVNAAPAPRDPSGDGGAFRKIGKNRWAYSVTFTRSLKAHPVWNFGVQVGRKTIVVKVRVVK